MASRALATAVAVLAGGLIALAPSAEEKLSPRWLFNEGSEFARAEQVLRERFGHDATLAVLLRGPRAEVDMQGPRLVQALERSARAKVLSPWSGPQAAELLRPRGVPLLVVDVDTRLREYHEAVPLVREAVADAVRRPVEAHVVGVPVVGTAVGEQSADASHEGERLAAPILLGVLLWILRTPLAVAIPLFLGLITVQAGRGSVSLLAEAFTIDPLVLSMVSTMGLALGVDYGLLMVTRFREQLDGRGPAEAARATRQTAGRTVLFAGIALLLGLGLLMALPIEAVVRSFALGAAVATLISMTIAVVLLPPVLARIGHGINRWRVGRIRSRAGGGWMRVVRSSGRRPLVTAIVVGGAMLALAWPATGLDLAAPDFRQLPAGSAERRDFAAFERVTGPGWNNPFELVVSGRERLSRTQLAAVARWEQQLAAAPGISQVAGASILLRAGSRAQDGDARRATGRLLSADGRTLRALVIPEMSANDAAAARLYDRLRRSADAFAERSRLDVGIAGAGAWLIDVDRDAATRLPVLIVALAFLTFFVLTTVFRAPLLALVAVGLNLLTVACCFGGLSLLASLGLFGETEFLDSVAIAVIFTVIFGLSIDYEVFLLSRIKEAWDSGHDAAASVDLAIERTGSVLTGAAVILCAVFLAFATTDIASLRQVGVGLAIAIFLDATVVRLILLPALLRLLGRRSWWLPPWLDRLLPRVRLHPEATRQRRDGDRRPADPAFVPASGPGS